MKALLMCGDRNWVQAAPIRKVLIEENPNLVIEGEASGADTISRLIAEHLEIRVQGFPADWKKWGKIAGPIRNRKMLDQLLFLQNEGWGVKVYAFHDNLEESKGTKDMVRRARKAGIEVHIQTST